MQITSTALPGVLLIVPEHHLDGRGFFSETFREAWLSARGIDCRFVQDNHSLSREVGVVRGLHFQIAPFAQAKLVRVAAGAILDIAVDLRRGSPSFGRHVATRLSTAEWNQIFIPEGFAHGFCVLEPDTQVLYKASQYYSATHERGLLWNDPALGIEWPVGEAEAILSDKDRRHPRLAELPPFFA
jgi:dTDP-4-dehydrorhamnose 3,5-epimerase